jgi:hypothetical protein
MPKLDWITILIEAVGVAILLMWIVIPIREFRQILRVLKHKRDGHDAPDDFRRPLPVDPIPPRPREDGPRA